MLGREEKEGRKTKEDKEGGKGRRKGRRKGRKKRKEKRKEENNGGKGRGGRKREGGSRAEAALQFLSAADRWHPRHGSEPEPGPAALNPGQTRV